MKAEKIILLLFFVSLLCAFFYFDLHYYANLDYLKIQQHNIIKYYALFPISTALIFFAIYVLCTALSLPVATVLTLAAGSIFGLLWGTLLVSFASTIGATLAFLFARFLFRTPLQLKFSDKLKIVNEGIQKDGAFYLFALRVVPIIPFFVVNLLMGLTPIRAVTFFLISQIGMLPITIIYVNAGTQLTKIKSVEDILSIEIILSFIVLGTFSLLATKIINYIKRRRNKKYAAELSQTE